MGQQKTDEKSNEITAIPKLLDMLQIMVFDEDASRARNKNVAENLAILRHITLNIIKNDKTVHRKKLSIKTKRKKASWNPGYLADLIGLGPVAC